MKKASALLAASLTGLVMITMSATQLAAAGFENFGRAGAWHVSGQQGQCEIGRGLEAGQMEFVLSRDGTVITLQSLTWTRMRQPRSNMFKVTVYFDKKIRPGRCPCHRAGPCLSDFPPGCVKPETPKTILANTRPIKGNVGGGTVPVKSVALQRIRDLRGIRNFPQMR